MTFFFNNIELSAEVCVKIRCFWPLTASTTSEVKNDYAHVITQNICNKFVEIKFLYDVQFGCDAVYDNTKTTPDNSKSIDNGKFVTSILTVDIMIMPLCFLTCNFLYLKLKFVSNTFWTKIPKSSHSGPLETCRNKAYCKIYTVLVSHQPNGGYLPRFPFCKAISFFDEKTFFTKLICYTVYTVEKRYERYVKPAQVST